MPPKRCHFAVVITENSVVKPFIQPLALFPFGKSGFIIVPEVSYIPNKGLFSMGNPTNFLCLKGVLYCFGIISVPNKAFL